MSKCEWKIVDWLPGGQNVYETACGRKTRYIHRGYIYCPYCGKTLIKKR